MSEQSCAFCGQPVQRPVGQGSETFCSEGCRQVANQLGTGTGAAQTGPNRRSSDETRVVKPNSTNEQNGEQEPSGSATAYLHVDGMHCATCETFLERTATNHDGVSNATASYVTETVRVTYDPFEVTEEELCDHLSTVGYRARPRGQADDRRPGERGLDDLLGFRYAAGIVFGTFMLLPYIVVLYPAQLPSVFAGHMPLYSGEGGILLLPVFMLTTGVVLVFTGLPLLRGAYVSIVLRQPNTDLLVATTITAAYVYGFGALLFGRIEVYFDLTVVVAAAVVAAIFYESLVKQQAVDRLTDLTVSQVEQARRDDGEEVQVEDVEAGDRLLVREGERVPVDGTLAEGSCTVDEAVVTGESIPVRKTAGDTLVGGSVVTADAALLEAGDPPTSSIDWLTESVWNIQSGAHGRQRQTDRVAAIVVPVVVVIALLSGLGSLVVTASPETAIFLTLTAVIALCPWALGLSTPLSVATSIRGALERGIVVFDETVFERLRETDVVVFDKTGTLTTGDMRVLETTASPDILAAAAALESRAAHPAGVAIAAAYGARTDEEGDRLPGVDGDAIESEGGGRADGGVTLPRVDSFRTHGNGVSGTVDGVETLVGNVALFETQEWTVPPDLVSRAARAREAGNLPVLVGQDGAASGLVVVGDENRTGWKETIDRLADREIEIVVLTGDNQEASTAFLAHAGVDHVLADVPPAGKTAAIRRLQERGHVTMVGDGTNDAPALAAANLGVALGSGTALASDAADIAIVDDDLAGVETAFDLATVAGRRLTQNTGLALLYNALTIPLAALGLLNPLFAMGAVAVSGGLVALNADRDLLP